MGGHGAQSMWGATAGWRLCGAQWGLRQGNWARPEFGIRSGVWQGVPCAEPHPQEWFIPETGSHSVTPSFFQFTQAAPHKVQNMYMQTHAQPPQLAHNAHV